MTTPPAKRVAIRGPRSTAARPPAGARRRLDEQDAVAVLLVRSLVRAQLRLALRTGLLLVLGLGSLPLLFVAFPALRTIGILGLPLPWLVLGVLVYPWLVVVGVFYVRAAERNEADLVDLIGDG